MGLGCARAPALWRPGPWHSSRLAQLTAPAPARGGEVSRGLSSPPSAPPRGPRRRLTSCPPRRPGSPRWPAGACAGAGSCTRPGPALDPRHSGSAAPAPGRWGLSAGREAWGRGPKAPLPSVGARPRERLCSRLASSHCSRRPGGGTADLVERAH